MDSHRAENRSLWDQKITFEVKFDVLSQNVMPDVIDASTQKIAFTQYHFFQKSHIIFPSNSVAHVKSYRLLADRIVKMV